MNSSYDVVIIGGGPAGLSAALYAARGNLKVLVVDSGVLGGKLNYYKEIENYPCVPTKFTSDLITNLIKQVKEFNVDIEEVAEVSNISTGNPHSLKINNEIVTTENIIIATGTKPKMLGIGEERFIGRGVSFCATCDGNFYKDKVVAVIGGGNSALEEAFYLSGLAKEVYIIHRRDSFRADKSVQDKLKEHENIKIIYNKTVSRIVGDKKVESIILSNGSELKVDGVFLYIGVTPIIPAITTSLELSDSGFIIANEKMETSIKGIYAVGDVRETPLRQVVTATSDGAIAGHFCTHK